ncbi:MAG: immunoglobulin-like domain-containing protein, partial [Clostridia bacterium]|nr:immunoglobulin-like domain-containing protein [Clostridia bacterium]
DEYCAWAVDESVNNGYPYHTFASMPDPDEVACKTDLAAITIESRVSSSFSVPTRGENGTSIEWASDDESAIVISDGTATVICDPDSEKTVKLTVAVSKGEFSVSKEITVVVEKLVAKYIKAGEKQSVTNPDGTVTVTLDVDYGGIRGQFETLTYMAVITDSTGRILQRVKDDASVETSGIGTASFEVTHREASANETVSYYLWGDDNISLLDNKPSAIKDFEAKSKVKGITLSWAQSYDDSGDPVKYKIYRKDTLNETLLDTVMTNTYIAAGSDTESYSYKVVPVDTADESGESKETAPMKLRQMFYNNPDSSWGINKTSVGGSDSYFVNGAITIDDVTYSVYTSDISSRQHYIYFSRDMDVCDVTSADSDLVFEIDYYDKGAGALTMVYNSIVNGVDDHNVARKQILLPSRTNTETFKTAVIRISDAQLRESEHSSESSFGILIPKDTPANSIIIKEIRVCKAEDYE